MKIALVAVFLLVAMPAAAQDGKKDGWMQKLGGERFSSMVVDGLARALIASQPPNIAASYRRISANMNKGLLIVWDLKIKDTGKTWASETTVERVHVSGVDVQALLRGRPVTAERVALDQVSHAARRTFEEGGEKTSAMKIKEVEAFDVVLPGGLLSPKGPVRINLGTMSKFQMRRTRTTSAGETEENRYAAEVFYAEDLQIPLVTGFKKLMGALAFTSARVDENAVATSAALLNALKGE